MLRRLHETRPYVSLLKHFDKYIISIMFVLFLIHSKSNRMCEREPTLSTWKNLHVQRSTSTLMASSKALSSLGGMKNHRSQNIFYKIKVKSCCVWNANFLFCYIYRKKYNKKNEKLLKLCCVDDFLKIIII